MLYFNLFPDYNTIAKYYKLNTSPDLMYKQYSDGFAISLDMYYTDEAVAEVETRFKAILTKYHLAEHYENLMYLTLSQINQLETLLYELNWAHAQKVRTKQLAGLLLTFKESSINKRNAILLKTNTDTAKVSDKILINIIGDLIIQGVKEGKVPLAQIEYGMEDILFEGGELSITKLKAAASKKIDPPMRDIRKHLVGFCLYLYPYLINETNIKQDSTVLISDKQANFYFDVLSLFEFINPAIIDSEPKDYMRSLFRNNMHLQSATNQGNKTN